MLTGFRRTLAVGMVWGVVVAIAACQRTADVPVQGPARKPSPVTEQPTEQIPPLPVDGDTPEAGTESEPQVPPVEPGAAVETEIEEVPKRSTGVQEAVEAEGGSEEVMQAADGMPSGTPIEGEKGSQPELPTPLVDDPSSLKLLQPSYPIWIDGDDKRVVMVGRVCQRRAPLELFACTRGGKEHESVLAVNTEAWLMHAALLAVDAEPGSPVAFVPEYVPASGTEIEIAVIWEDESGRRRRARAQDWVRDVSALYERFQGVIANQFDDELNLVDQHAAWKSMEHPWVFAGSQFVKDEQTGEGSYLANAEGELICVSNFPTAVLDVPIRSSDSNASLMFETFTERIPPLGTPVTMVLTPVLGERAEDEDGGGVSPGQ